MSFKSGFIAIIGRPNVGKSTLLNAILETKIAITTPKAQTTRNNIKGIYTTDDAQIVFVDTPGIHNPQQLLGSTMVKEAWSSLAGVDLVYFLIDAGSGMTEYDKEVLLKLKSKKLPIFLLVNKIDKLNQPQLFSLMSSIDTDDFQEIIPISALESKNLDELLKTTKDHLVEGPKYYPDNQIVDYPEQFIIAELVREKLMMLTQEEVPHSLAVTIENIEFKKTSVNINCLILVEKESQKGIVIGKGGHVLKETGSLARKEIETLLGKKVYLQLFVRVEKDWRNKQKQLQQLGFILPKEQDDE